MLNDNDWKQFMREFFSPLQRWRYYGMIDSIKAFLTSWKSNNEDRS